MSKQYRIIAKYESFNKGNNFCNITVKTALDETINIKLDPSVLDNITVGKAYVFNVINKEVINKDKDIIEYISSALIEDVLEHDELNELLPKFYTYAPIGPTVIKDKVEAYLEKIENPTYYKITKEIYDAHKDDFYIHPAATKFHHAYAGGLSYHTLTMLELVDGFLNVYTYLDKDLIYATIIIHDIKKIDEITGVDGEYTVSGQLLGHIAMGVMDIDRAAIKLDLLDTEEVMLLKHTMLAHHGQLHFGSPKKPQTGEALLIWYIDTIDSKLGTLGDVLETTEAGTFTTNVPVLDKMRFYKSKKD